MKADEYRYWQSRPAHERLDAVEEMIETAYALKGWEMEPDEPRPFVRPPCPWRWKSDDILPDIPGVDFDAAREKRVEIVVDTATG